MKFTPIFIAYPLSIAATFWLGLTLANKSKENSKGGSQSSSSHVTDDFSSDRRTAENRRNHARHSNKSNTPREEIDTTYLKSFIAKLDDLSTSELFELLTQERQQYSSIHIRRLETELIINTLIAKEPVETLNFLYQNQDSSIKSQLNQGLYAFAKTHPQEAMEWLNTKRFSHSEKLHYRRRVIEGTAETNVKLALRTLSKFSSQSARDIATEEISHRIAQLPITEAWGWVQKFAPKTSFKLIQNLPKEKYSALANLINQGGQFSEEKDLAYVWAHSDADATMEWLSQLPMERSIEAASSCIKELCSNSPQQASQWLEHYAGTEAYRHFVVSFLNSVYDQNPRLAAAKIHHFKGKERIYYRNKIYNSWLKIDKEAAERFKDEDEKAHS